MAPAPSRRDVLRTLIGGASALSLPFGAIRRAYAQSHHTALTSTRLSETLTLISGAGGNVVVVTGNDLFAAGTPIKHVFVEGRLY